MSFIADQEDDDNQSQVDANQQGSGNGAPSNPSQSDSEISLGGGGSGVATPGGGNVGGNNASPAAVAAKPSSSGAWTNLQSYLNANSGQGDQIGSQIASTVGNEAQTAQNDVNSAASDFQKQVDANTVNANPSGVNSDIAAATGAKAGSTIDPNAISDYQKQANASYAGPTDFTTDAGYTRAQNDVNSAENALSETRSEAGRDVLLNNTYGGAPTGYNQGEQNLDQALLEGSPGGQSALSGLQSQWGGLGGALTSATNAEDQNAKSAVATDQATSDAAKQALATANTGFENNLNSQLAVDEAAYPGEFTEAQTALQNNTNDPSLYSAIGLTPGENLFGVNPSQFLQSGITPTLANTASADQYAQAAALAALGGAGAAPVLASANAGQAGTASPYSFQTDPFTGAVSAAKTGADNQESAFINSFNAILNSPQYQSYEQNGGGAPAEQALNTDNFGNYLGEADAMTNYLNTSPLFNGNGQEPVATNMIGQINTLGPQWAAIMALLNNQLGVNGNRFSAPVAPTPAGSAGIATHLPQVRG